jgi:hypothetical protein
LIGALGIASGLLVLVAYAVYVRSIVRGITKPQRTSWFIWGALALIAFFTQLAKGATASLWLPGADAACALVIAVLGVPHGIGGMSRRDMASLIVAAIALILWYFTSQPVIALGLVILVDAIAAVLTIIKTYQLPETESFISWVLGACGGVCAVLAVGRVDPALLAYPVYFFLWNGATAAAILLGRAHAAARGTKTN